MPLRTEKEEQLIIELRNTFIDFSGANNSTQGENRWLDNLSRLNDLVMTEDPSSFLQWDVIKRTMDVGDADFIDIELDFLKKLKNWKRWESAIREVPNGSPTYSNIYPKSSGNLIHHAYHVAQFESMTTQNINNVDCIFEFGGGYGSICRLVHNLGFSGKYIIFDFPEFSALQNYYIKNLGIQTHTVESFKQAKSGVLCISDIHTLQDLLLNYMPINNSLFLATWSLSECPGDLRIKILSMVVHFKYFLIAYQGQFEDFDNIEFFNDWKITLSEVNWFNIAIEHIPNKYYRDNFYLVGYNED